MEETSVEIESSTSSPRETEPVPAAETTDRPDGDDNNHLKHAAPVNASQLRDRTRKKRHTIKKLEKKLEVLHRQIKK